tara:strand:+ start:10442 stop:11233 length:792 start_codon:yes stop_codon:yes gene_type:complete
MTNSLKKIINDKKIVIEKYKKNLSLEYLEKKISLYKDYLDFKSKLMENKISVIAEIKKASPSAGIIVKNYDPKSIAKLYLKSGASCLSILTDEKYFQGQLEHIDQVKKEVKLPVLCKDFFIDPYQVYLAKSFGADAILIILSAVNKKIAEEIYKVANQLSLGTIIEVHTVQEAEIALDFKNAIVGINNRDLKTLKTNISTTYNLYKILCKHNGPLICESGIKSENEVKEIVKKTKINNFLIGESLLNDLNNLSLLKKITQITA